MARFVILEHDHPHLHWDLMLEVGGVLRTWRLAQAPAPGITIAAEPLGDHRIDYLDYEGPVSGNRGTVRQWDGGEYLGEVTQEGDEEIVIYLDGIRCNGWARIARGDDGEWSFRLLPPGEQY